MLSLRMRTLVPITMSLALAGCSPASSTPPDSGANAAPVHVEPDSEGAEPPEPSEPIDPQFTETLRVAAAEYAKWGRVDERPNLAPMLCRAPAGLDFGFPSHARLSAADDAPHGRKLYYLFAGLGEHGLSDLYGRLGTPTAEAIPIGFTIVKQSWAAVPSSRPIAEPTPVSEVLDMHTDPPTPISWVEHEGKRLEVGEQAELFVMAKVGEHDMPGTDAGWIYGTLSADGKTVTSAGLVQRCMDCHEAATHERLFGLQKTKAFATVKPSPWSAGEDEALPASLGLLP
jgi:hypothetical protein